MPVSISGTNGVTFPDNSLQTAAASPFGLKNRIINGDMRISQRGTTINSITSDWTYTADRWSIQRGGTINYSQGTSNPPTGFQYYASFINQTASNPFLTINQMIESSNTYDLLGQTVTLSMWIKAAANTAASTSVSLNYGYSTSADTRYTIIGTATTFAISSSSWTKCSITFTVPSNALSLTPVINSTSALAVNDGYFITGVQLEIGTTATPFERRMYGQELALCQRYYYRISPGLTGATFANGYNTSTTISIFSNLFPTVMRTNPSALEQSGTASNYSIAYLSTAATCSAVPIFSYASAYAADTLFTVASGLTAGQGCQGRTNSTAAYLGWSAEL